MYHHVYLSLTGVIYLRNRSVLGIRLTYDMANSHPDLNPDASPMVATAVVAMNGPPEALFRYHLSVSPYQFS